MYINFYQKRVSRSVKTVLTNIFAKICKLHKFATTNSSFKKIDYFRHVSSCNVYVYQFLAISGLYRSVKTVYTNLFAKNGKFS